MDEELKIEKPTKEELRFIHHSFLVSFYKGSNLRYHNQKLVFKTFTHHVMYAISNNVLVAKVDGVIVGWICWDDASLETYYIYVRHDYRRNGVAGVLLAESGAKKVWIFPTYAVRFLGGSVSDRAEQFSERVFREGLKKR